MHLKNLETVAALILAFYINVCQLWPNPFKSLFLGQGPAQESEGEEDKEKEAALKSRRSRRQTLAMARKRSAEEDDINASQMANLLTVLDRHQIQARVGRKYHSSFLATNNHVSDI